MNMTEEQFQDAVTEAIEHMDPYEIDDLIVECYPFAWRFYEDVLKHLRDVAEMRLAKFTTAEAKWQLLCEIADNLDVDLRQHVAREGTLVCEFVARELAANGRR